MSSFQRPSQKASASRPKAMSPLAICLCGFVMAMGIMGGAGLLYWGVFRDDVLEALLQRQTQMQYAYEDRLASLRAHVDRVISRQLLDQNTIEGRMHDLLSRQALLESRSAMLSVLADQVGVSAENTSAIPQTPPLPSPPARPESARINPLLSGPVEPLRKQTLPPGVSAYSADRAPVAPAAPAPAPAPMRPEPIEKPRPEGIMELRSSLDRQPLSLRDGAANADLPAAVRLSAIGRDLERIERDQVQAVARIGASARQKAMRLKAIISETGLSPEGLAPMGKAVGGPFAPLKADPGGSAFERELSRIAADHQVASRLNLVMPTLPLRRPLAGRQEITSGYGSRMDPFLGRMALHTGLDMREDTGAPVRATGGGRVVSAGWSGGYGNMVEIDHGNDLSTRYGHLSSISVAEGQIVAPGAMLGRVGSTGRSTGPHLHYEVRVDGEAVDPVRFLRASDKVAGLNCGGGSITAPPLVQSTSSTLSGPPP